MPALRSVAVAIVAALAFAACTKPVPPDEQDPPEPQARARPAQQATELHDAIQAPIDKAKAVDAQVQDAAAQQRAAIDAQTGG